MSTPGPVPSIDVMLLSGFTYACRPDCGLCCYAEPLVAPAERPALIRIIPEAEFVTRDRSDFLVSYPDGGACRLLQRNRCRAHTARPSVCREFPLTAHVGIRLQATVVLTCPGVDLAPLDGYRGPGGLAAPRGFDPELSALRGRADASVRSRIDASGRRRRRLVRALTAEGRWEEDEEVRHRLRAHLPTPTSEDFPTEDPPSREDGAEWLPLVFDGRAAPVAFAQGLGGWELLELRSTGGVERSLGVVPPPEHLPPLSGEAERLLAGYLRYWLERDLLFGAVHLAMLEGRGGSVTDWVIAELHRIGALTLSRAYALASVRRGIVGRLSGEDVRDGLRATDQDLLDRTTWGSRL